MLAQRRLVALLTLSLAAALTLSGIAAATLVSKPASSVAASGLPPQVRRTVVWYGVPTAAPRSLHIESTAENASAPDEFQISYQTGNFTLVYQRAAQGPITNQYTLSVNGMVEWNDTGGDFNFEEGTLVAYQDLGPGAFGRFPIQHSERTTADGIHVDSFLITSNRGDIAMNLTIADGFVTLPSGQTLTPMEAKLTLEINHTMALPNTQFSLQMGIATDQNITLGNQSWDDLNEFSSDDHAVNVTNDALPTPSAAFFAWSNTASVNGERVRVTPSGLFHNETAPGSYDLILSYPRPSGGLQLHIVHDPTIGVAYLGGPRPPSPLPFEGDALVYAVSLVGIAVLVAGTALLVSRRRKGP